MATFDVDKKTLLGGQDMESHLTGQFSDIHYTSGGGDALRGCRVITGEGAYYEFSSDVETVHLYWPATTQSRVAKYHKGVRKLTQMGDSVASVLLDNTSTFLPTEPPKSEPWMVSHTFASAIIGLDVKGPCVVATTAEPIAFLGS